MSIDREAVRRFADLARLRLGDAELDGLTDDVNRILEHVDELGRLEDVDEPGGGPQEALEASELEPPDHPDALLRSPEELAPEWRDGFFVVPRLPGVDPE